MLARTLFSLSDSTKVSVSTSGSAATASANALSLTSRRKAYWNPREDTSTSLDSTFSGTPPKILHLPRDKPQQPRFRTSEADAGTRAPSGLPGIASLSERLLKRELAVVHLASWVAWYGPISAILTRP